MLPNLILFQPNSINFNKFPLAVYNVYVWTIEALLIALLQKYFMLGEYLACTWSPKRK